jgi:integrase
MKQKRLSGEGTVFWNARRKCFVAQVMLDGRRVSATGQTKREAFDNLDRRLAVNARDIVGLPSRPTFETWWEYARTEMSLDGSERTAHDRHEILRHYVLPIIGNVRLGDIRAEHGDRIVREVARRGLSTSTQRSAIKRAKYVLNLAVKRGLLERNPLADVKPPRVRLERRFLNRDEIARLQESAKGDAYEVVPKLLLALGLRNGELCGLEWKHVHLDGKRPRVEIRQQIQDGKLDAPKCGQFRTLRLSPNLVEALEKHRARQQEIVPTRKRSERWDGHDFVVTTPSLAPLCQHDVREILQRLGADAGISPDPKHGLLKAHELRYTAGSVLLDAGADLKEISVFLGHSDIRTTANIYVGLYESSSDRLAELADTYIL